LPSYELIPLLLALAVGLGILAQWMRIPYPIFLVIGGLLISLQPGAEGLTKKFSLDPNLIFFLFLPPLLYAGAFNTQWPAFRSNLRSILLLSIGLVLFTMTLVAAVAHYVVGMDWVTGFILGAIISPPDAIAALSITQRLRVPSTITSILEGESLVNDATALVAYRMGIACVTSGVFSLGSASIEFFLVSMGGLFIGLLGAMLIIQLHQWLDKHELADNKISITITLLTPYAVYFGAEHFHFSGVLAAVAAGMWVGTRCETVFKEELYLEAKAVWEMMEFLLNSLIFLLIGLQLPQVLSELKDDYELSTLVWYATAVSLTVIAARMIWMFPGAYVPRWLDRKIFGKATRYPPWQNVTIVGWTGMRGVVSLAAALALAKTVPGVITVPIPFFDPLIHASTIVLDGNLTMTRAVMLPFPDREMILFLTFWVIFATLVLQGLSLPWLIRGLGLSKIPANQHEMGTLPMPERPSQFDEFEETPEEKSEP
jgi:monovalent cation/hydrogen antiporter